MIIHAKIKTRAVKCNRFHVIAAIGIPRDTAVPISRIAFPAIASIEAVEAVLYPCLNAANPKGTRKKNESITLLCRTIQRSAAINAGI